MSDITQTFRQNITPMEEKLGWFPHSTFKTWAEPFEDKYQMIDMVMIGDPAFAINKTRKEDGRHCIFCGKNYPETTFRSDAHLLSRMIGNTDLFSTFECDSCNNLFSKLETDVASFLGVGRSIIGMNDEGKAPGYPGIDLKAKAIVFNKKKLLVIHKENAQRNAKEGTTSLNYRKASYRPANVYKLFLKCALSILPNDEVLRDYQLALTHLRGKTFLGGAHINVFRFPLTANMPLHVYLFQKKFPTDKLPAHVAQFYFDNLVVNVPVLLHREDLENMNQLIQLPAAPPYFVHGCDLDPIIPTFTTHDLSSPLKSKFEPEELIMQFNKSQLENTIRIDATTGKKTEGPHEPAGSNYFIQLEAGTVLTEEEIPQLLKVIEQRFAD